MSHKIACKTKSKFILIQYVLLCTPWPHLEHRWIFIWGMLIFDMEMTPKVAETVGHVEKPISFFFGTFWLKFTWLRGDGLEPGVPMVADDNFIHNTLTLTSMMTGSVQAWGSNSLESPGQREDIRQLAPAQRQWICCIGSAILGWRWGRTCARDDCLPGLRWTTTI